MINQSRELLRCNFGWAGRADGYYLSKVFDPSIGPIVDGDSNPNNNTHPGAGLYNRGYELITY